MIQKFKAYIKSLDRIVTVTSVVFNPDGDVSYIFSAETGQDYYSGDVVLLPFTGYTDMSGAELYDQDLTELWVEGERRVFKIRIREVIRNVENQPDFEEGTSKVSITGVVFEWLDYKLFPCVGETGKIDTENMLKLGNYLTDPQCFDQQPPLPPKFSVMHVIKATNKSNKFTGYVNRIESDKVKSIHPDKHAAERMFKETAQRIAKTINKDKYLVTVIPESEL